MKELLLANDIDPRVVRAFFAALETFGQRPDVTGVDVGIRMEDGEHDVGAGAVIRVHVREKKARRRVSPSDAIPRRYMGVRTDVVQARYVKHQGSGCAVNPARTQLRRPVEPGLSVGRADDTTGTLGLVVREVETGRLALLGADHVIAPEGSGVGDALVQPAPSDGGAPGDVVARAGRWNRATASAIAFLDPAVNANLAQFESATRVGAPRIPTLGSIVEKSGRTTGITQAMVDGLGSFDGVFPAIRLVPEVADVDDCPISDFGDSGSVWYDPETAAGIGLQVKGNANPNPQIQFGIASSLLHVLKKLRVEVF